MSLKLCQAKDPLTCRVHGTRIEVGLRGNQSEEAHWTLKTFNQDYQFANWYLNEEDRAAIRRYTGLGYLPVNKFLYNPERFKEERLARVKTDEDLEKFETFQKGVVKIIDTLDKAFEKVPNIRERKLFRSFEIPGTETKTLTDSKTVQKYIKDHFMPGSEVNFKSFLSTSIDSSLMASRVGEDNNSHIVFEITTNKGLVVEETPLNDNFAYVQQYEREVLLPRDMKFKVSSVTENVKFQAPSTSSYEEEYVNCYVVRLTEINS